ncbi:MAG: hypothetical protein LBK41_09560 [Clostridiales bacterium]|jgi:hypothetical protein|nr:hypothetical protein [Clostridiales bacterium]
MDYYFDPPPKRELTKDGTDIIAAIADVTECPAEGHEKTERVLFRQEKAARDKGSCRH